MVEWMIPFLAALGTGVLSSWGVGGGTLLLVVMTLFLGVEHRAAQAINLLFFLPTAAASLFFHREKGFLDKESFRRAAVPGAALSLAGALLSTAMDVSLLRKPFGLFLLYSGASMLASCTRRQSQSDKRAADPAPDGGDTPHSRPSSEGGKNTSL